MRIDTRARGFLLTDAIQRHVESRVESALEPVSDWIISVTTRLEDVNADRGGVDKRCGLVASIRGRGVVVAESLDIDLYRAIDDAASRLRRAAIRAIMRPMARERRDAQRPPGALLNI